MGKIFPDPYAPQIKQALEQGLRGIAKVCAFTAQMFFNAFPQAEFFVNFGTPGKVVTIRPPTAKTAAFSASAGSVETTQDTAFSKSFAGVGVVLGSTTTTQSPVFTALAEVFQI